MFFSTFPDYSAPKRGYDLQDEYLARSISKEKIFLTARHPGCSDFGGFYRESWHVAVLVLFIDLAR
jgi:hypothetical protein